MTSLRHLAAKCCALLAVLLLTVAPSPLAHAQSGEPVKLKVEVTDSGFKPGTIEVEQGQMVELTFVWAHQAHQNEEHIMVLEGYKLESNKISSSNKEATIKFIADKAGTFTFKCDLDCELHNQLQNGAVKVKSGGGAAGGGASAGAAGRTATSISLEPSAWVSAGSEAISLKAVLKDASGNPVPKADVRFFVDTSFGGVKGKVLVASARTDANGVATRDYTPTIEGEKLNISAQFEGMGVYGESEEAIEVTRVGARPSAYQMAPTGLEHFPTPVWLGTNASDPAASAWTWSVNNWGPLAITLTVLGAWATILYGLVNAYRIARAGIRR